MHHFAAEEVTQDIGVIGQHHFHHFSGWRGDKNGIVFTHISTTRTVWTNAEARASRHRRNQTGKIFVADGAAGATLRGAEKAKIQL
jgi:hypothetical protein